MFFFTSLCCTANAKDYNDLILEVIEEMPKGGAYKVDSGAAKSLGDSISTQNDQLKIKVDTSGGTYCSGATYLVFLKVLEKLSNQSALSLKKEVLPFLHTKPNGKWLADGHGLWGRWNANGPGTAAVFSELNLGENFVDNSFTKVKAGDFMKIFWKPAVGKYERGHSVVFTKVVRDQNSRIKEVCFWSSNQNTGLGHKCVERNKISHALFSRLSSPENINNLVGENFEPVNNYLKSLLRIESSFSEAMKKTNAKNYSTR